jgi:hypothetical protein
MSNTFFVTLLLSMSFGAARPQADGQQAAHAQLAKAIKAVGGDTNLARYKAISAKGTQTFQEDGVETKVTYELFVQRSDQMRTVSKIEEKGQTSVEVEVINGTQGWTKTDDEDTEDMDEDELREAKDFLYADWVSTLVPLRDPAFRLTLLEECKVGGRPALGLKVAHKGHRDIFLYFDKGNGLPVKMERLTKDPENDKQVTEEVFFERYKKVQGTQQPTRIITKWDGKLQQVDELSEIKLYEKLDDKLFAKP